MRSLTKDESCDWLRKASFSVDEGRRTISFPDGKQYAFLLSLPSPIYRVSNFANSLILHKDKSSTSSESLIWLTDWGLWNEVHEKTGQFMLQKIRRTHDDAASAAEKPGQQFDASEGVALQSFFILPILFSWDAYLAPKNGDYFVFNSHDEFLRVVSRSVQTHETLMEKLKDWNPKQILD